MNRPHPFDLVFAGLADEAFPAIRAEAGDAALDAAALAKVPSFQRLLAEVESPDLTEQDPGAAAEYLVLLFVAYRYWLAGAHTVSVDRQGLDAAILRGPQRATRVPHGACYVALPPHSCWATIGEDQPHEPIDGMFVVMSRAGAEVTIAAILGLRESRQGFSQVTVTSRIDDVFTAAETMRDPPFAPVMEGGRDAGFKSVVSEGELLLLTHLALESTAE